jgi:hypothetical protein
LRLKHRPFQTPSAEDAVKLVDDPGVVLVDMREGGELHKTGRCEARCVCPLVS